ncbi:AAA family ATPase [Planctomycetota bacterium]|nr:AAA family ATPase [Planctomycetota bacterium]
MILGKFMPPHMGHKYLIDFGRHYVDELTVLVCTRGCEEIDGEKRWRWMNEMFGGAGVKLVHVTDDLPQVPEDDERFWEIWRGVVLEHMPEGTDYVFACEAYGYQLADVLDAKYVPVDRAREMVPVSATMIREDPLRHWEYLPECVRPEYVKRVCLFGPESTGKSTLAAGLAKHFETVCVGEHARPLLDHKEGVCEEVDIPLIAKGQRTSEDALALQANRLLICDTDALLTCVWSEKLFGGYSDWLYGFAMEREYDLYLLLDIDVPWVNDGQRYLEEAREDFMVRCVRMLEKAGRPYLKVSGDWGERFEVAVRACDELIECHRSKYSQL